MASEWWRSGAGAAADVVGGSLDMTKAFLPPELRAIVSGLLPDGAIQGMVPEPQTTGGKAARLAIPFIVPGAKGGKLDAAAAAAEKKLAAGMSANGPANTMEQFHTGLRNKVNARVEDTMKKIDEYVAAGKFPFKIGDRFTTEHSRRMKLPPVEVVGYHVDSKDPLKFGYRVRRINEPKDSKMTETFMISNPAAEERMAKAGRPISYEDLARQFQKFEGPKAADDFLFDPKK